MANIICSQCGNENEPGSRFCDQCGNTLQEAPKAQAPVSQGSNVQTTLKCPSCGKLQTQGGMFCGACGASMANAQPAPANEGVGSAGSAAGIGGVASVSDASAVLNENMDKAKQRMDDLLGLNYEEKLSSRGPLNLDAIRASSRDEVTAAFAHFGINVSLPVSSQEKLFDDEILAMANAINAAADQEIDASEMFGDGNDDKRKTRTSVVAETGGTYASQFAHGWSLNPGMIEDKTKGSSMRKEHLERQRHRVEAGDISSNEAAASIDANRNATTR